MNHSAKNLVIAAFGLFAAYQSHATGASGPSLKELQGNYAIRQDLDFSVRHEFPNSGVYYYRPGNLDQNDFFYNGTWVDNTYQYACSIQEGIRSDVAFHYAAKTVFKVTTVSEQREPRRCNLLLGCTGNLSVYKITLKAIDVAGPEVFMKCSRFGNSRAIPLEEAKAFFEKFLEEVPQ